MIEARDLVQVLPPFNEAFPDNYGVTAVNGSTATLETGADFDMAYLVKVGVSDVAVPFSLFIPSTTTASSISGSYVETQS